MNAHSTRTRPRMGLTGARRCLYVHPARGWRGTCMHESSLACGGRVGRKRSCSVSPMISPRHMRTCRASLAQPRVRRRLVVGGHLGPESGVESAALICRTIKSAATGRDLERYSIRERRDMHGDTRETVLSPHGRLALLAVRSVAVQNATNSLLTRLSVCLRRGRVCWSLQ